MDGSTLHSKFVSISWRDSTAWDSDFTLFSRNRAVVSQAFSKEPATFESFGSAKGATGGNDGGTEGAGGGSFADIENLLGLSQRMLLNSGWEGLHTVDDPPLLRQKKKDRVYPSSNSMNARGITFGAPDKGGFVETRLLATREMYSSYSYSLQ